MPSVSTGAPVRSRHVQRYEKTNRAKRPENYRHNGKSSEEKLNAFTETKPAAQRQAKQAIQQAIQQQGNENDQR